MKSLRARRVDYDNIINGIAEYFRVSLGSGFYGLMDIERVEGLYTGICMSEIGDHRFISGPDIASIHLSPPLRTFVTRKLLAADVFIEDGGKNNGKQ